MSRRQLSLDGGDLIAFGEHGLPVLVFPSEGGDSRIYEDRHMVDAVSGLLAEGRAKLYCVDSLDRGTWSNDAIPLEERARRHETYERWIVDTVVPWIHADCGGPLPIAVTGPSFGAYHAANFALKRADLFPLAICHSGVYDVETVGWGERGDAVYFNNPMAYVANAEGDHLDWLRSAVSIVLTVGRGSWEDTTGALDSTHRFAELLDAKGIPVELDVWGEEWPHDWPTWRAQFAHHLPRHC